MGSREVQAAPWLTRGPGGAIRRGSARRGETHVKVAPHPAARSVSPEDEGGPVGHNGDGHALPAGVYKPDDLAGRR
jgi:hypothetical protein